MPQAIEELRKKFMTEKDRDGVGTCEAIIISKGGRVCNGHVFYSGEDPDALDAIDFLCQEWDCTYIKTAEYPILVTKKIGLHTFLCVRKSDTENPDWHILSSGGVNYGSWQSIDSFVEAHKRWLAGETKGLIASPLGRSMLSVRSIS